MRQRQRQRPVSVKHVLVRRKYAKMRQRQRQRPVWKNNVLDAKMRQRQRQRPGGLKMQLISVRHMHLFHKTS
jgi:hypothetical protein